MGPLVWGADRMLAWGAEMEVQLSAPEKTCRLLPELSIKFTLEKEQQFSGWSEQTLLTRVGTSDIIPGPTMAMACLRVPVAVGTF